MIINHIIGLVVVLALIYGSISFLSFMLNRLVTKSDTKGNITIEVIFFTVPWVASVLLVMVITTAIGRGVFKMLGLLS